MTDPDRLTTIEKFVYHAERVLTQLVMQVDLLDKRRQESEVREAKREGEAQAKARFQGLVGGLLGAIVTQVVMSLLKPKLGMP